MLATHAHLIAPIAQSVPQFVEQMQLLRRVIRKRQAAYTALHAHGLYPDHLDEYNAAVEPEHRLSRVAAREPPLAFRPPHRSSDLTRFIPRQQW